MESLSVVPGAAPYGDVHHVPVDTFRLPAEICDSIIADVRSFIMFCHGGVFQTDRHQNYPTTDLDLIKVIDRNRGLAFTRMVQPILNHMTTLYQIPSNLHLVLSDFFFAKYEPCAQNALDRHTDGTILTFVINLTDPDDYLGGTLLVGVDQHGVTQREVALARGCALTFAGGMIAHSVTPVQQGSRFVLVGFVEICHAQRVPTMVLKDWCSRLQFEAKQKNERKQSPDRVFASVASEIARLAALLPPAPQTCEQLTVMSDKSAYVASPSQLSLPDGQDETCTARQVPAVSSAETATVKPASESTIKL